MYSKITFQCRNCGIVVKVLVRDNHELRFRIIGNNFSEKESLDKSGYFKCCNCDKIDPTKRFEKVFN